jgi:hypothetical protein
MFVGKARNLPKSGAPEMCFAKVGSGLTYKQKLLARDKHSSLLRTFVNFRLKNIYNIGP